MIEQMSTLAAFENGCFVMDDGELIRLPRNATCDGLKLDSRDHHLFAPIIEHGVSIKPTTFFFQGCGRDLIVEFIDGLICRMAAQREQQTSDVVTKN